MYVKKKKEDDDSRELNIVFMHQYKDSGIIFRKAKNLIKETNCSTNNISTDRKKTNRKKIGSRNGKKKIE